MNKNINEESKKRDLQNRIGCGRSRSGRTRSVRSFRIDNRVLKVRRGKFNGPSRSNPLHNRKVYTIFDPTICHAKFHFFALPVLHLPVHADSVIQSIDVNKLRLFFARAIIRQSDSTIYQSESLNLPRIEFHLNICLMFLFQYPIFLFSIQFNFFRIKEKMK